MEERYIASIDLGSSKFGLCVARVCQDDVQIVYYKETPSDGIKASIIANPMKASIPLRAAIEEAEKELMIKILQVVVGMPRSEVSQVTASATIKRGQADEYISDEEVASLKSIALETYPLSNPESQIMYGAVAQSFSTDSQICLTESDVVGTLSDTLEGNFKVFIGSRRATTALDKIFNSLQVAVAKKYFLPDVIAKTVLSADEMQGGVALVDIGAGVTSLAIYHDSIMRYYAAIPFGGRAVTQDIRNECSISEDLAEKIKKRFGACLPNKLASLSEKVLQIRLTEPYKEVSVKYISEIVDCRMREIFDAVLYHIQESGLQNEIRSGIVLTGGGASLANVNNLMKDMSGYEVRTGCPKYQFSAVAGNGIYNNPAAAAAVGMVLAAKEDKMPDCVSIPEPEVKENEETVEVEIQITDNKISDEELNKGETGDLGMDFEKKEPEAKPKETTRKIRIKREKSDKQPGKLSILWNTLMDKGKEVGEKVYDFINEE